MGEQRGGAEGQADIGGADDLTRQCRERLADLGAEKQAAHLVQHPGQRARELAEHR